MARGISSTNEAPARKKAYVPPFKMLQNSPHISADDLQSSATVSLPVPVFKKLITVLLQAGLFDERWYLETYPDVYRAIKDGNITDAFEHYATAGYYEGRSPGPREIDRKWYEGHYTDVAEAIKSGKIVDSAEHFYQTGHSEGRAPCAGQLSEAENWHKLLFGV